MRFLVTSKGYNLINFNQLSNIKYCNKMKLYLQCFIICIINIYFCNAFLRYMFVNKAKVLDVGNVISNSQLIRDRMMISTSFMKQLKVMNSKLFYSAHKHEHVIVNSDEEDEDEEEETSVAEDIPIVEESDQTINQISLMKEGINFSAPLNGSDVRIGIIATRWNADIISGLMKGVNESLVECGVKPSNVFITYVPGAFEIPMTAKFLTASKRFDVIICLGCLIKGETMHFEYIAQAAANGIMQVQLESFVPLIFGVLTVLNKEQAIVRSTGTHNEGISWGKTAVEMGLARMSALGIGIVQKPSSDSSAFVNFNSTQSPNDSNNSTSTDKNKKFGF